MYLKLVKVFFKENFSLKRLFGINLKNSKAKTIGLMVLMAYVLVVFLGGFGFMFFDLAKLLNESDQLGVVVSFAVTYTLGLSIMMALLRSSGYIFHYKDYDILAPLPLKGSTVLFAKLSVMLLMVYLTSTFFVIPIFAAYFFYNGLSFFGLLYAVIGFLLAPLIPIVVLSFVNLLITKITQRLPFAKLLNIVLMFALFIGIFAMSFTINESSVNPLNGQIDVISGFAKYYPLVRFFVEAVHETNHLSFLLYTGISLIIFYLYVVGIQRFVRKTNQSKQNAYINRNKKVTFQSNSIRKSLILKEFKTYFSIPIYVLNTGLGVVIIFALSVASLFFKSDIETVLVELTSMNMSLVPLLLVVFGFSITMTYTPSVSLSLEGKHFWILKSLPVDPFEVMLSKILFNVLLVVPVSVIGVLLLSYSLEFTAVEGLLLLLSIAAYSVLSSTLFSFVNLYFPKFEFNNEVEVIKQSIASFISVFGGFALLITLSFGYYWLNKVLTYEWCLLIIIGVMIGLNYLLFIVLKKAARKQFINF
ncbi:MAG: hypothetical protein RBQ91_06585 [Acholeplasma sp.]|nr:hypothetical protein [Acholeplasma sp.]